MKNNYVQRSIMPAPEKEEQAALVQWLRTKRIPFVAHMTGVNLHGNFALINALKRVGCLQAGIPDIFIPIPVGDYHGLWIEMKREVGGVVSPEQQQWMAALSADGYAVMVCHGADEAIRMIEGYINVTRYMRKPGGEREVYESNIT